MIQAVILVGGEGRRLRPLTDTRPKPMMNLVDRPFVAHQLDLLRRFGVTDVVFSCGYRPEALEGYFGDGAARGMRVRYVVDPKPLGTAGAIKNAEGELRGAHTLVLNGDVLTDLDLAALVEQHQRTGVQGTLALTPVDDPGRFGLVRLYPDRMVEEFLEKPAPDQLRPGEPFLINAGTYLLERAIIDRIPPGQARSIERDIFPVLAGEGAIAGFPSESYWRDIGTPASYLQAHLDVLAGAVRTESPAGTCYLGPHVTIGAGARAENGATIGPGATIGEGSRISASVVGEAARIGADVHINGAIVGHAAVVGDRARLGPGTVVGDGATIAADVAVDDVTVPTGATIDHGDSNAEAARGTA